MDGRAVGEVLAEALGVAALTAVVQFGPQRRPELPGQLDQVVLLAQRGALLRQRRQLGQDRQVECDGLLDVGALHLDDNMRAVVQHRGMDLTERRGGQRLVGELAEDRADRPPKVGLDRGDRQLGREGWDGIL